MDDQRFDNLIKTLAAKRISRAGALRGLVGGTLAAVAATALGGEGTVAKNKKRGKGGKGRVAAQKAPQASAGKITICHRTSSETNPVVVIRISANAKNPHVDHHDDFVPADEDGCCLDSECADLDDDCNVGRCRVTDDGEGACVQVARDPLPDCDDGLFCTVDDRCVLSSDGVSAVCTGDARDCSAEDDLPCITGVCDEEAGECVAEVDEGASCSTGDECLEDETCQADGACGGGADVCGPDECATSLDCNGPNQCCCAQQGHGRPNRCVGANGCTGSNDAGDPDCCRGQNANGTVDPEDICPA
jgi:hypothetical protein